MLAIDEKLHYIHNQSCYCIHDIFGKVFNIAGNIAIFCQNKKEYGFYLEEQSKLCIMSDDLSQKYFPLHNPLYLSFENKVFVYTHLYIRKVIAGEFHVGDIDFIVSQNDYHHLKTEIQQGPQDKKFTNLQIYKRPGRDMIEVTHPDYDVLSYISTQEMAEKVRFRF